MGSDRLNKIANGREMMIAKEEKLKKKGKMNPCLFLLG